MTAGPAASGRRILAVDDELQILRALKLVLRSAGYEVLTAANVEEALDVAAVSPVDAAIVDLLLPDRDGIELRRRLREWSSMPIILLSAVGEEGEKVRAFRSDAADYVTKPFGPQELVARLEAVLRRSSPEPEQRVIESNGLEVDFAAHILRPDGEKIHLTPTEFELLRELVRNRGAADPPGAADRGVGPEYADDITVLRGQISNLRRKLEPAEGDTEPQPGLHTAGAPC